MRKKTFQQSRKFTAPSSIRRSENQKLKQTAKLLTMKKLQLLTRIDIDQQWWIIRFFEGEKQVDEKFYSNAEMAMKRFEVLTDSIDKIRQEEVLQEVKSNEIIN